MRKIILSFMFLLICNIASAELWVCQSGNQLVRKHGDGYKLGIATINYNTIDPNCIMATPAQYTEAGLQYKKLSGGDVVDWTQAEIDAYVAAQAQAAIDAEIARLTAIDNNLADMDITGSTLTRIETEIDNIGSYSDLKKVLKRIVRYIANN